MKKIIALMLGVIAIIGIALFVVACGEQTPSELPGELTVPTTETTTTVNTTETTTTATTTAETTTKVEEYKLYFTKNSNQLTDAMYNMNIARIVDKGNVYECYVSKATFLKSYYTIKENLITSLDNLLEDKMSVYAYDINTNFTEISIYVQPERYYKYSGEINFDAIVTLVQNSQKYLYNTNHMTIRVVNVLDKSIILSEYVR